MSDATTSPTFEAPEDSSTTQTPAGWYPVDDHLERYWSGAAWTAETRPRPTSVVVPAHAPVPLAKRRKRVFLWFFLAVQALFIIWIITGAASGNGQPSDCGGLDAATCNSASDAGTAIGVVLIILFWVIVDFLLAVIYGVYRLARRPRV